MNNEDYRDLLIERRQLSDDEQRWWDKLTMAQKFSASGLTNYGYKLAFVRYSSLGNLAVFTYEGRTVTITDDGVINTTPNMSVRH